MKLEKKFKDECNTTNDFFFGGGVFLYFVIRTFIVWYIPSGGQHFFSVGGVIGIRQSHLFSMYNVYASLHYLFTEYKCVAMACV